MSRIYIDTDAMRSPWAESIRAQRRPEGHRFNVTRLGHAVLRVQDLDRSVAFYTQVLGFEVSDVYPESMMPGAMVFLRFNTDHHGLALMGGADADAAGTDLHHMAFEVATLDDVVRARDHLLAHRVDVEFEGRRRAGCQIAIEFRDPDGHCLEIYWGVDQVGAGATVRTPDQWRPAASLAEAIANPPSGQDTTVHDTTLTP